MYGLYTPANSLLRRWLETTIYALYFDSEFKGNSRDNFSQYNNWLGGAPVYNFKDKLNKVIKDTPLNDIYLFSWDEIPGNDSDRLIDFLKQNYGIDWVKIENIEKIDDGKIIKLSNEQNSILLELNTEKHEMYLKLEGGFKFIAETVNGKLKIINFSDIVYIIFSDLSKDVHYGGIMRRDLKHNFSQYNNERFENWFKKLNQINEVCWTLILSKFPDMASKDKRRYLYFNNRIKRLKELLGVG